MTEHVFDDLDALRRAGAAEDGPRKRKTPRGGRATKDGPFVMISKTEAAAGFLALDCQLAMVWLEIIYLVWKTKSTTVVLATKELERFGVDRWAKGRALSKLEQAKLVRVIRFGGKSPRVTLLKRTRATRA
jgi:hypothetical protein